MDTDTRSDGRSKGWISKWVVADPVADSDIESKVLRYRPRRVCFRFNQEEDWAVVILPTPFWLQDGV